MNHLSDIPFYLEMIDEEKIKTLLLTKKYESIKSFNITKTGLMDNLWNIFQQSEKILIIYPKLCKHLGRFYVLTTNTHTSLKIKKTIEPLFFNRITDILTNMVIEYSNQIKLHVDILNYKSYISKKWFTEFSRKFNASL